MFDVTAVFGSMPRNAEIGGTMEFEKKRKIINYLVALFIFGIGAAVIILIVGDFHSEMPVDEYFEEVRRLPEDDKPKYKQQFFDEIDNPKMPRILKPNHTQLFDGEWVRLPETEVRINSHGFRGGEHPVQKPSDTVRILGLGDSFTFGWGLNLEHTFLHVLEEKLNLNYGGAIEVLNFGLPGGSTTSEVELFKTKAARFAPDLILLTFTNNDDDDIEVETRIRRKLREEGTDYIVPEDGMGRVEAGAYMMQRYMETVEFDENWKKTVEDPLRELIQYASEHGIDLVVYSLSLEARKNDRLRNLGGSSSRCFFLKSALNLVENRHYHLHALDDHPNAEANRLMAEELFAFFGENDLMERNAKGVSS